MATKGKAATEERPRSTAERFADVTARMREKRLGDMSGEELREVAGLLGMAVEENAGDAEILQGVERTVYGVPAYAGNQDKRPDPATGSDTPPPPPGGAGA